MIIKYILSLLLSVNIIISLISIIYNVWNYYKESESMNCTRNMLCTEEVLYSSQNLMYLYIPVVSTLISILYLTLRYNFNINKHILNNVICIISFILTILWIVIFIYIILYTKECLNLNVSVYKCEGGIINIVIGLISLCIWFSILYITSKRLLKPNERYPAVEAQASNEMFRSR
jgi:hypothetical protein